MRTAGIIIGICLAFAVFGCKSTSGGGDSGSSGGTVDDATTACGGPTQGCVIGNLVDADTEAPVADVVVSVGGEAPATSLSKATGTTVGTANAQGWFFLSAIEASDAVTFCFQQSDYVTLCRNFEVVAQSTMNFPPIGMTRRAISQELDADAGGTLSNATTGAEIVITGGSVCGSDGTTPASGAIDCSLTAISGVDAMPGYSDGIRLDTSESALMAAGMMEINCVDSGGSSLELCTGHTAQAKVPIFGYTECAELVTPIQSWRMNESSGLWTEYGTFIQNCGGTETTSYYSGTVDSFTWWAAAWPNDYTCMQGSVLDTVTEEPNSQAIIECDTSTAQGKTERARFGGLSDVDGTFCTRVAVATYYSCQAKKASFVSNEQLGDVPVTILTCPHIACWNVGNFSLEDPIVRTTLTWLSESSSVPSDLDTYFISSDLSVIIYYAHKGDLTVSPYIAIDTDAVSWSGPENLTVVPGVFPETYRLCIHKFSDDGDLAASGAQVVVSGLNVALPRRYNIPTSPVDRLVWRVCDIAIGEDGVVTITDLNELVGDLADDELTICME